MDMFQKPLRAGALIMNWQQVEGKIGFWNRPQMDFFYI